MSSEERIDLLDHGFVRLIDSMGNDLSIVRAARVSYDAAWRTGENEKNDHRLLRRLWDGGKAVVTESPRHSTPFEAVAVTFEIQAPVFVFRQWHRHRTQSYNEVSARYTELPEVFYVPDVDAVGVPSDTNRQVRVMVGEGIMSPDMRANRIAEIAGYKMHCEASFARYRHLLACGWPRELARCCLPFSTYSHMFATANLLNWLRFLSLRCDPHAQYEIKVYADAIANLLESVVPCTMELWYENRT